MKWFTKGEIFTFSFNFDLNRRASKKKMRSKCLFFSHFKKRFPLVNDKMNRGSQGGSREKLITFLLRGRVMFCYHVNRFLIVSLLSEIFT